ncbi:exported hypothetical protein [Tenacibaculum maritimum]|uniref:hypothetical protein n=1 Tax=Tenacibaculum maritimum TaxID=107401 RepID=UPI0012E5425E|nr:hypothetical protein [Tenacibaculum maritimum]CAA0172329.1 exported hypothetical protein [Tenacibaculum maritimum]
MKKIITFFMLFVAVVSFAQEQFPIIKDKVSYTEVVELKNSMITSKQIQDALFFFTGTTTELDRKSTNKVPKRFYKNHKIDVNVKRISNELAVVKILNYYRANSLCLKSIFWEYDFILKTKNGRYKYELTNFNYTHYNHSSGWERQQAIYSFKDKGPCASVNTLETLFDCKKCKRHIQKMYTYLHKDNLKLIEVLKKGIADNIKSEEDW